MATVSEHPWKRSIRDTPVDDSLLVEDGWDGIDVQWLITSDSVGSAKHVFGYTVIHPGGLHHPHRHPNAEEAQYLVAGHGIVRVEDADIELGPGEVVFTPADALHSFRCTSEEPAVMLWTYGGATNLDTAGYVRATEEELRALATVPQVSEHRWKRSIADTPVDGTLSRDDGWDAIDVQWLITSASVGARHHVLGYTVVHPGGAHHPHRHANAEEVEYVVSGRGVVHTEDADIELGPGDVLFTPVNGLHGFRCTSDEPAVIVWTYGGAPDLAAAGYSLA